MTTQIIPVNFHGNNLFVIDQDGAPFTPMKSIVEGMGLDWKSQHAKLASNAKRWGMVIITIPTKSGIQEAACLPLRKIFGWLSTISPNKIKDPAIREKVITYQNESDDVLWDHWNASANQSPNLKTKKALPNGLSLDQCDSVKALVKARVEALPKDKQAKAAITCWSALKSKFGCTYKAIEPELFPEALSLVARVELEGEYLGKGDTLPAPQDLPPISVSNLMLDGLSKLTIKLPIDVESAVRQKALSMAMEAHGICLEHLLSSIAYSHQNEMARGSESGFYKAIKLVEDTNLDRALAHKFYEQLGSIKRQVENAKVLTNRYFDEICSALPKGLH